MRNLEAFDFFDTVFAASIFDTAVEADFAVAVFESAADLDFVAAVFEAALACIGFFVFSSAAFTGFFAADFAGVFAPAFTEAFAAVFIRGFAAVFAAGLATDFADLTEAFFVFTGDLAFAAGFIDFFEVVAFAIFSKV